MDGGTRQLAPEETRHEEAGSVETYNPLPNTVRTDVPTAPRPRRDDPDPVSRAAAPATPAGTAPPEALPRHRSSPPALADAERAPAATHRIQRRRSRCGNTTDQPHAANTRHVATVHGGSGGPTRGRPTATAAATAAPAAALPRRGGRQGGRGRFFTGKARHRGGLGGVRHPLALYEEEASRVCGAGPPHPRGG